MSDLGMDKSFLNGLLGQTSFNGIGIDVANMVEGERPPEAIEGPDGQMYANNVSIGPDGTWVSNPDLSEPVYFYTQGLELGDARGNYFDVNDAGVVEQQGQWRTEAEIKAEWDADEGMGYFKQENPNLDFDTYMNFISESTALYNEGGSYAENSEAYQSLAGEYGIAMSYQNDDGDVFQFNGSNFTKTSKVDDSIDVGGMIMSIAVSAMTAGALAGPITSMLGSAGITGSAATAATKAITSMVTQIATTGDIDLKQALISAAMAYGGDKLGDVFASSTELDGAIGSLTNTASETFDKMQDFIATGNSIADAAIKAGGMSLLTQMVSTGEVNLEQALMSAAIAGGTQGLLDLRTNVVDAGLATEDELEEIIVTAQKKGTQVADGLTALDNGLVINSAGEIVGNMSDLDLDGDGLLSGNDLQNVTTNNQFVSETPPSEDPYQKNGARVYLDSEGNVYTQDQIGSYVDGSAYGDIYMVNGQEVLLEQGTMINGRMMFDGDGDGVFDVVYNDNGVVVGSYNSETKEWEDASGNTSASIGEYMSTVNPTTGESGIENPFDMSREAYEAMTGEEYVRDLFTLKATAVGEGTDGMLLALDDGEVAEMVARFEKNPYTDPVTGEVLSGQEGLERFLQNEGIGVNYSGNHGWRFESGVDTSDGIYGIMADGNNVADVLGAPDTTKDSTVRTIADIDIAEPIDDDPFTDPEDVIKEIEDKYSNSEEAGGQDGGEGETTNETNGSPSTDSPNATPNSTSSSSSASAADAAALAAAYAAAGLVNPHVGTGSPLDPTVSPVDPVDPSDGASDLPSDTTSDSTIDGDSTGNTGEGIDDTGGETVPGDDGDDATDTTNTTGGGGTGESTTGSGTDGDSTDGSGTAGTEGGTAGTGTTGDTGDTSSGTNPEGTTVGEGPTFGDAVEGPGGYGDGLGLGGSGGGMMAGGGDYTPQWGELFAYTTLTPYQKRQLEPMKDAIAEAKGMLA